MVRFSSFLKVFTAITLVFLFFQTGTSLVMKSSKGVDHFASTTASDHMYQLSRKMMQLDYGDPEANTNKRSGLTQPDHHHSPDPPTPDHD